MSLLSTTRRRLALAASGLAVASAAVAFALTSGASASSSPTPPAPKPPPPTPSTTAPSAGHGGTSNGGTSNGGSSTCRLNVSCHRPGLLARTDYATIEVFRHGHWDTLVLDRGNVTAASTDNITIQRPDGVTVTIALAPTTKYRGVSSARDLKTNRAATVLSVDGSALRVVQLAPSSRAEG